MKHRDAQVIIDRTDGCKSKHYLDTDEESAKNRESKLNSHSVDGVAVSTGSKPHITRIKKDGGK